MQGKIKKRKDSAEKEGGVQGRGEFFMSGKHGESSLIRSIFSELAKKKKNAGGGGEKKRKDLFSWQA